MRRAYDFSKAKRVKDVPHLAKLQAAMKDKTRITIMLDNDVIEAFRTRAEQEGRGYQTAINDTLRAAIQTDNAPVTVGTLRRELKRALKDIAA
ncbi:MAG: BrnA antitoxin family protein [Proteobacteria bacterium]|nr:BrnA antitoxin family protein [Pseudomonadota bacterium]